MSWKDHKGPCRLLGNSRFCKVNGSLWMVFKEGVTSLSLKVTSLDHSGYCAENEIEEHHQLIAVVQTRDDGGS